MENTFHSLDRIEWVKTSNQLQEKQRFIFLLIQFITQKKDYLKILPFFYNMSKEGFHFLYWKQQIHYRRWRIFATQFLFRSIRCLQLLKTLEKSNLCLSNFAIVKAYFNFSNFFLLITNLKGEIQHWVSAASGQFEGASERTSSQAAISLALRVSNLLRQKRYKRVKIQYTGPSKQFRMKIYRTLQARSWLRKFSIDLLEETFCPSFNGCRLKRAPRK